MKNLIPFQLFSLIFVYFCALILGSTLSAASPESLSLVVALRILEAENPNLEAAQARARKEEALIKSQYALPDPMLSYQRLDRGNSTQYWGVSQKIEFPTSYFHRAGAQRHKARKSLAEKEDVAIQLRGELIATYYEIYSIERMIEFTEANRNAIREVARVAEKKYASGGVSQSDSMRAHVEQTSLEVELRLLQQQLEIAKSKLKAFLNIAQEEELRLPKVKLKVPSLPSITDGVENSYRLRASKEGLLEAKDRKADAIADILPDVQVRYQRQFAGLPENSDILMLEASVPLWFWGKTGKTQAAIYETQQKQAELSAVRNQLQQEHQSLSINLKTQKELLDLYETALIPQAQTSYNATSSAYRASKASFLDLLERERFLLGAQVKYYATLIQYVRLLVRYEQVVGKELINVKTLQEVL